MFSANAPPNLKPEEITFRVNGAVVKQLHAKKNAQNIKMRKTPAGRYNSRNNDSKKTKTVTMNSLNRKKLVFSNENLTKLEQQRSLKE